MRKGDGGSRRERRIGRGKREGKEKEGKGVRKTGG